MRASRARQALFLSMMLAPCARLAAQEQPVHIWIEGEEPVSASFDAAESQWETPLASGGVWLTGSVRVIPEEEDEDQDGAQQVEPHPLERAFPALPGEEGGANDDDPAAQYEKAGLPAGGFRLAYEFEAEAAGKYELWARIGFENVRAPLDWRIDGGEWSTVSNELLTTNVMELATWVQMAWIKVGMAALDAGKHTVEVRFSRPGRDGRVLWGLDCLTFVEGEGNFHPEGLLKPGAAYEAPRDGQARDHVFAFPQRALNAGPAERIDLLLNGPWMAARYDDPDMDIATTEPVKKLPDPEDHPLRWMGINVPGDAFTGRQELALGHRFFYRARVDIPASLRGRGFKLHFAGTCWIVSVIVNGRYCGYRQSVLVPWDLDITDAVEPGCVNTITLGVKSGWYALDTMARGATVNQQRGRPTSGEFHGWKSQTAPLIPSSKGEGSGIQVGVINPVKLMVTGPVCTTDIFIRTSVANKRLDADVTVLNTTGADADVQVRCEAVHNRIGKVEKAFEPVAVRVPAGASQTVAVGGPWEDPKLWWPAERLDDRPDCYVMRTTILAGGKPVDVQEELFGFREVSADGRHFLLNGVRWHFWNWVDVPRATRDNRRDWLNAFFAENDRFHRISSDHSRIFGCREDALLWLDRHGVPGRLSTCIDGMKITLNLDNPLTWQNFENHVRQVVMAYRNHPSIMQWSLGNELMLITARLGFGRNYEEMERRASRLHEIAKKLDPTRMSYQDGGGDLGGLGEMNCQHYSWGQGEGFPAGAYSYPIGPAAAAPRPVRDRTRLYLWDGQKPLVLGEVFYHVGNLGRMAWIGGPDVYRSKAEMDRAAARYGRICFEGARWQDVTAICPWVRRLPEADKSFAPRAVFVREHNSAHYPSAMLKRTISVFNEGRERRSLTLKWKLVLDGKTTASGRKAYDVEPGHHPEDTITIRLPRAKERLDGKLVLELYEGTNKAFEDSKPISVLPKPSVPSELPGEVLCVFDPGGETRAWLEALGQSFRPLASPDAIPEGARVLLIGRNGLPEDGKPQRGAQITRPEKAALEARARRRKAVAERLEKFVLAGNVVIALEQDYPLVSGEVPAQGLYRGLSGSRKPGWAEFARAGGDSGCIAFPVASGHPAIEGLRREDFFTWAGRDEVNFVRAHTAPMTGAACILLAGEELKLTPMVELPIGAGSYLFSQMVIAEKLGVEPTADRLLYNLLNWAAGRIQTEKGRTLVYTAGDGELESIIWATGTDFKIVDDLAVLSDVFSETVGPRDEDILGDLDDIGGEDDLGLGDDMGVPDVEVNAEDIAGADVVVIRATGATLTWLLRHRKGLRAYCERGGWLMLCNLERRDVDAFGKLVGVRHRIRAGFRCRPRIENPGDALLDGLTTRDLNQLSDLLIAEWMKLRSVSDVVFTNVVDAGPDVACFARGMPGNMANGLRNNDFWHYISYLPANGTTIKLDFGWPETFTHMNIWTNESYFFLKDIEITFDDDPATATKLTLQPTSEKQPIEFGPRRARKITIKTLSCYPRRTRALTGIDLVEIYRELPEGFNERVVPLAKPGGLVKYPIGKGGIVLNQVDYASRDLDENMAKKQSIYSNLLRNMGASMRPANVIHGFRPKPKEVELRTE